MAPRGIGPKVPIFRAQTWQNLLCDLHDVGHNSRYGDLARLEATNEWCTSSSPAYR
jgi:hypothetical protein